MRIFIDAKALTDGSLVYAVRLTRFEDMPRSIDTLVIDAVSREDAEKMADKLYFMFSDHSTEVATRAY
jgi:hypothetical protein